MEQKSVIDLFNEGLRFYKMGDYRTALANFAQALEQEPENPRYLSYAGLTMVYTGTEAKKGFEYLHKAIKADAARGELYHNAFLAYKKINNLKKAFDLLYEGEKQDPANPTIKKEFQMHGRRKSPPLSFVGRDHFLNKYLGIILNRLGMR